MSTPRPPASDSPAREAVHPVPGLESDLAGSSHRVVIHVGFHKTGTTALQRGLFPTLPGIRLVVPFQGPKYPEAPGYRAFNINLGRASEADYSPAVSRSFLAAELAATETTLVVSDEALSGSLYRGPGERERTAERLSEVLPSARVLMVVRDQATMIRAFYSQYVHKGGHVSFGDYIGNRAPGVVFELDYFRYDALVSAYQRLFGAEQVKVLAYEQLQADPSAFLDQVVRFVVGEPGATPGPRSVPVVNPSLSRPARWVLRGTNRVVRRSEFNRSPRLPNERLDRLLRLAVQRADRVVAPRIPAHLALGRRDRRDLERLLPHFGESNARLGRLTALPLRELGYVVSDPTAG